MQRAFSLELKSVTPAGEFEGLASVYGNVDETGDVVEPGSFTKTLNGSRDRPLLWQHRDPVGLVTLSDTTNGLQARGKLSLGVQAAADAYQLLKDGVVKGLSIGFTTVQSHYVGEIRHLSEIKLWEVSLVTFPANELATVSAVKSARAGVIRAGLSELRRDVLAAFERK